MINLEKAKSDMKRYMKHRNRHHSHVVAEILYYKCPHMKEWRAGIIKNVIPHYGMTYYVLEVEVPSVGDSFLELVSEFNVLVEGEL